MFGWHARSTRAPCGLWESLAGLAWNVGLVRAVEMQSLAGAPALPAYQLSIWALHLTICIIDGQHAARAVKVLWHALLDTSRLMFGHLGTIANAVAEKTS